MSKPQPRHPKTGDKFPTDFVIVQGFHKNPSKVSATLLSKKGAKSFIPTHIGSQGTLWFFAFEKLDADDYTLKVKDNDTSEEDASVTFTVSGGIADATVRFSFPIANSTINQSFSAWGTTDSILAGTQKMVGNNGTGAETDGTPSLNGSAGFWVVPFAVTDNPFQNTYTCIITNASGPASITGLTVQRNPGT